MRTFSGLFVTIVTGGNMGIFPGTGISVIVPKTTPKKCSVFCSLFHEEHAVFLVPCSTGIFLKMFCHMSGIFKGVCVFSRSMAIPVHVYTVYVHVYRYVPRVRKTSLGYCDLSVFPQFFCGHCDSTYTCGLYIYLSTRLIRKEISRFQVWE